MYRSVITGTGCYIPPHIQSNREFEKHRFYTEDRLPLEAAPQVIVEKFRQITGIDERRYTTDNLNASDIGSLAAQFAINDSGVDPETIDQLIVAHNFGNVIKDTIQTDAVPSLASHIKHALNIQNPDCIAYDILIWLPRVAAGVDPGRCVFQSWFGKKGPYRRNGNIVAGN